MEGDAIIPAWDQPLWGNEVSSILIDTGGLSVGIAVALLLTISRTASGSSVIDREQAARLLLVGIALQCAHFFEEDITRFH